MIKYLTIFNTGYTEFTINNILNYLKVFEQGKSQLILTAIDEPAYNLIEASLQDIAKDYDISGIILKKDFMYLTGFANFNTTAFIDIMHKKINVVLTEVERGGIVHFFDGDVAFFIDPTKHIIEALQDNDIVFQQDAPYTHHHNQYHNYVCAGNFSVKSNDNSITFLKAIVARLNPSQNDQEVLYSYLNGCVSNIKEYVQCKLDAYDQELFQNGFDAFQHDWYLKTDKISIHANHMIGRDAKIGALKKANTWFNI